MGERERDVGFIERWGEEGGEGGSAEWITDAPDPVTHFRERRYRRRRQAKKIKVKKPYVSEATECYD
jgi:hypothetical protein